MPHLEGPAIEFVHPAVRLICFGRLHHILLLVRLRLSSTVARLRCLVVWAGLRRGERKLR
jgi:hypothetical protein